MKRENSATFAKKKKKKSLDINTIMTKIIVKLKASVIIVVNTEVLYIAYVI